jgi:glycosyltransferase involved in cell wall biosynthesis
MADVFCLPTLQEGCCNAIVEALACGLPVISSDRSFNYDILNESNSILIDPIDEDAIAVALRSLYEDKALRAQLSQGALIAGESLTIDERAKKVLSFIDERINLKNK